MCVQVRLNPTRGHPGGPGRDKTTQGSVNVSKRSVNMSRWG